MKKVKLQNITLGVMGVMILIGILLEVVTALQVLPIFIAIILGKSTQQKKVDSAYIIVLSILMIIGNIFSESLIDTIAWVVLAYSFWE